jgi:cysteine desulfurase
VERAYLDWNATAPLRCEARAAMLVAMDTVGNPSSVHAEGRRARAIVEAARGAVARLVGARPSEVVFTSGGTEANGMALAGGWRRIVCSAVEHESVLAPARRSGAEVVLLPVDGNGVVVASAAARVFGGAGDASPTLLSLQLANNETGVIQPVAEIAALARAAGATVHVDAVQGAGRLPLGFAEAGIDLMSVSAHKIGGPKGVGALIVRDSVEVPPLIAGGGQEGRRRAGTENVVGIAGFGAAAEAALGDLAAMDRVTALRGEIERLIATIVPEATIVGETARRLPNTVCFTWPGKSAETLLIRLDLAGVAVSSGAACSSGKVGPSHVLAAMGLPDAASRSALRVSIGAGTTAQDIARFGEAIAAIARPAAGASAATNNRPGGPAPRREMMMGEA